MIYTEQTYKGFPVKILGSFDNGNISIEVDRNGVTEQYIIKPHQLVPIKRNIESPHFSNKYELYMWFYNLLSEYREEKISINDVVELVSGLYLNCALDHPLNGLMADLHNELLVNRVLLDTNLSRDYYKEITNNE